MTRSLSLARIAGLALALPAVFIMAGFAADRPAGTAAQKTVTLAYRFEAGKTISYRETGTRTQNMDVQGQVMTTTTTSGLDFTITPKGPKGSDFLLGIVVNAGKSDSQTIQGDISADFSSVIGKGFDMVLSPLGKEVDVSGASVLMIGSPAGGEQDMTSSFQAFFPDLPDKPIKVGDAWPSEDVIVSKQGGGETKTQFANLNTLDGFETVDGMECARIKVVSTGTMSGTIDQGGMSMGLAMKIDSQNIWYFAVKEGLFLKSDGKATLTGTIDVAQAGITIAMTGETAGQVVVVKK
ncbi:MAG: hypothetical protein PHI34_10315 [Acidobacteriota bacterium]|nr:hypothetical protein [Acidobacteriota bacterium]